MKIYIFGNPLIESDNLPLKLLPKLKKEFADIDFVVSDPNEDPFEEDATPIIIDTAVGITDVVVLGLGDLAAPRKGVSLHDYDLGMYLLLKKKLGQIQKAVILGIPVGSSPKEVLPKLKRVIKSISLSKNESRKKYKGHRRG